MAKRYSLERRDGSKPTIFEKARKALAGKPKPVNLDKVVSDATEAADSAAKIDGQMEARRQTAAQNLSIAFGQLGDPSGLFSGILDGKNLVVTLELSEAIGYDPTLVLKRCEAIRAEGLQNRKLRTNPLDGVSVLLKDPQAVAKIAESGKIAEIVENGFEGHPVTFRRKTIFPVSQVSAKQMGPYAGFIQRVFESPDDNVTLLTEPEYVGSQSLLIKRLSVEADDKKIVAIRIKNDSLEATPTETKVKPSTLRREKTQLTPPLLTQISHVSLDGIDPKAILPPDYYELKITLTRGSLEHNWRDLRSPSGEFVPTGASLIKGSDVVEVALAPWARRPEIFRSVLDKLTSSEGDTSPVISSFSFAGVPKGFFEPWKPTDR